MEDIQAPPTIYSLIAVLLMCVLAIIGPSTFIVRWILAPIDRAAKFRKAPARFSIGDFLCLFLAIQIPLAVIYRFVDSDESQFYWLFTIATWIVGPVMWVTGARTLSKAGIEASGERFVFLGLIMPIVYYGLLPFTILGIRIAMMLCGAQSISQSAFSVFAAWGALAVLLALSAMFTARMVRQLQFDSPAMSEVTGNLDDSQRVIAGV
jgi:hypothetical protein